MALNYQDVIRDVHDPANHALQISGTISAAGQATVNIAGAATIYAVVNTSAAGVGNSIVTVANPNFGILGNVTLSDSKTYIGLTTATIGNNPVLGAGVNSIGFASVTPVQAWPDPKTYIGLVTITGSLAAASGNVTLDPGSKTGLVGTVTIQDGGNSITIDGNVGVLGNVTISDSKGFIGLVTLGGGTAWADPKTYVGLVTATLAGSVNTGMTTIFPGPNYIGLVTADIGTIKAWADPHTYIGLVTITGSLAAASGNITLDPGSFTGIKGNITLSDSKTYIGLTTATIGSMPSVLASGQYFPTLQSVASGALAPLAVDATGELLLGNTNKYIGLVSVSGVVGLGTGTLNIGSVSVLGGSIKLDTNTLNIGSVSVLGGSLVANLNTGTLNIGSVSILGGLIKLDTNTLNIGSVSILGGKIVNDTSTLNIGSVSVLGGGIGINAGVNGIGFATVSIPDQKLFIGLATTVNGAGTQFIGLVTAVTRNAGTNKTLLNLPIIGLSKAGSISTIAVPTNANSIYITNLVLNSDATVNVRIKSGVTYMNGNASLGITLNPGGGFVMTGAPDSPSWIGLPSGALIIEKFDMTGTIANLGGNVVYFQE